MRVGRHLQADHLSIGAQNDIEQASELARRMVTEWGMSETLGPIKYEEHEDTVHLGFGSLDETFTFLESAGYEPAEVLDLRVGRGGRA